MVPGEGGRIKFYGDREWICSVTVDFDLRFGSGPGKVRS